MHRVLIVTSAYSPAMSADMHRARQLAWELPKLGWAVEILCPNASYQPVSYLDKDSAAFFLPGIPVHDVPELFPRLFQIFGFKSTGWRAIVPMLLTGRRLLKEKRFDLVYISTTQFVLFLLGVLWKREFNVPFVLDFHDPCYKEGDHHPVWSRPNLKHSINRWLSRFIEAWTTTNATGLVSVSPNYVDSLRRRYDRRKPSWLLASRLAVLPFGALPQDFAEVARQIVPAALKVEQPAKIIYVGAGGQIMLRSFRLFCRALSSLRQQKPELVNRVRIELYGTMLGWREGDPRHLAELARDEGVADLIIEDPSRITYRRSLELLLRSDGALILGVDDTGYMPSKLFSYALSGKPLLASLRQESPAFASFRGSASLGHALWFTRSGEMPTAEALDEVGAFLKEVIARKCFNRREALEPYLARAMALRHAQLFEACL